MRKKIILVIFVMISLVACVGSNGVKTANADELTDEIDKQLDNIDLTDLENFFNQVNELPDGVKFNNIFNEILSGKFEFDFNGVSNYVLEIIFSGVKKFLPSLISVLAISIFALILQSSGGNNTDSVSKVVFWVCILSVFTILSKEIFQIYANTKNTIDLLSNLIEIMSPIMLTLMVACGGKVSAGIYSSSMVYLSTTFARVFTSVVLPLSIVIMVLSFIGCFSKSIRIGKLVEFINSLVKWIIGITLTVFTVFISMQGIVAGNYDGVSLRLTKYALSNSIPLIGGFIGGSMDLVIAGSSIIKNTVGLTCVYVAFYFTISAVLNILAFLFVLKFATGIIDTFSETKIPELCSVTAKSLTNLIVVVLGVGFAFLISVLLMILSVGAFL